MQQNGDKLLQGSGCCPTVRKEDFENTAFLVGCSSPENGNRDNLYIEIRVRVNGIHESQQARRVGEPVLAQRASMITAQPWDVSQIGVIEKAIRSSDLGLNPQNDGKIIRVPVPSLTEERRKNLVKHAHKQAEEGRVAVRNVRRDANEHLKKLLKDHKISEDEEKQAMAEVQKLTDQHIEEINSALKKKEGEIMEV